MRSREVDIEYITKELNKKFAAPLKEYYHRRVVFWYDPDKEFSDDIKSLALANAKIFVLTGSNNFEAKLLLHRDTENNMKKICVSICSLIKNFLMPKSVVINLLLCCHM